MSPVFRLSGDLLILDKALPLFKEPSQLFFLAHSKHPKFIQDYFHTGNCDHGNVNRVWKGGGSGSRIMG